MSYRLLAIAPKLRSDLLLIPLIDWMDHCFRLRNVMLCASIRGSLGEIFVFLRLLALTKWQIVAMTSVMRTIFLVPFTQASPVEDRKL